MHTFHFLIRMLRRDARAGELHLMVLALAIAVGALTAVAFFTGRVSQALALQANQLLGADLLLTADRPWPEAVKASARAHGLAAAETMTFPSMVTFGEAQALRAQLADVKAVSPGYPLRGALRIASALDAADASAPGVPRPGTVWVDARLAGALGVSVGDRLQLGNVSLSVDAILTAEPDRGMNFFSVAPRLMMHLDDLEATGLIQPGSRVTYRYLLAGEIQQIEAFRTSVQRLLERGQRLEDASNGRPEIRSALERAQRFLGLAALLTIVLAAVAVALAARRYLQRHLDPCAVMRCLGATQNFLLRVYAGQFLLLGAAASAFGCAIGYLAHFVLHAWLAHLLASPLPPPDWLPAAQGMAAGLLLLFGFALPPVWQLRRVPALRVLRRELFSDGGPPWRLVAGYAVGLLGLLAMIFWVAGDMRLGAVAAGGFAAALCGFAGIAWLAVWLCGRLRPAPGGELFGVRYGLASLRRHAGASVVQIVALSLGFMALLLLTVTRNELLAAWQQAIPPDAPNRFVINIQPDQREAVRVFFATEGVPPPVLSPMVRGRLTAINGLPAGPERYEDERAKRLIEREFNLSYRADLPADNSVSAGRWFSPADRGRGVASVEDGLAKTLGLKTGDRLTFMVAGTPQDLEVVGLRKLHWDSMKVNFFVLTPEGVLDDQPASWITSIHLSSTQAELTHRLVRAFPNLTVIDVAAIVQQLQAIMDQVARAVQFVFLFTVAAGVIVLYAALASAAEARRYELSILRALGARRVQLRRAVRIEFAAIGGLSGLIAALASMGVGQVLARQVFNLDLAWSWWLPPVALVGGAVTIVAAGSLAASRLMRETPLEALRAGG